MKQFISMGSIPQFRDVVREITYLTQSIGYDEKLNFPKLDKSIPLPKLNVVGYEKIHGTNASVCYNDIDGLWVQSRKNIIDSLNNPNYEKGIADNFGCAFAVYQRIEEWMYLIDKFKNTNNIDTSTNTIVIYYEWCGGSIQRNSAVSGLDRMSIIFSHCKVVDIKDKNKYTWLSTKNIHLPNHLIYNIRDFPKVELEIDFNTPSLSQNVMVDMVNNMENNSPVGEQLGIKNNIGEGYVFEVFYKDNYIQWKVKGEKYSKSSGKVKTLAPVDEELEQKKIDFVNNIACKEWRLDQMYNELPVKDISATGDYIKAVIKDTIKEESDIMQELGLKTKTINSMISKVARNYFFSRLDNE